MERKVSTKKYLIAFILTVLIFAGGIGIGIMFENIRLNYSEQVILSEKVGLRSLQLQQNYIDTGIADCTTLHQIVETNINELGKKMGEVIEYEKRSFLNEEEFKLQLQDYFLTEIQFLLTSQEIDKKCKKDSVKIIYFYGEEQFDTQGDILGYIKKLFGSKVLIFSFNSNFKQEPMISILLTSYNISELPAIVIENDVYQGHRTVEQVLESVCETFLTMKIDVPPECEETLKATPLQLAGEKKN